jgi:peptide/nickel transport system permease protein
MKLTMFIGQRIFYLLPALIGVSLIMFFITRVLPGNPAYMMVGVHADEKTLQAAVEKMGLDQPIWRQYLSYMGNLISGDLGTAWRTSNPVWVDLKSRLPATIELSTYSLIFAVLWGLSLGIWAAVKDQSYVSRLGDVISAAGVSIPEFWLGIILILIFFSYLNWAPPPLGRISLAVEAPETITGLYTIDSILTGNWEAFRASAAQLVLPVATLAFVIGAPIMRLTRTFMVEALQSDYVRAARAYGVPSRKIVSRHALRNVLLPVTTIIGMIYGYLLGGTVLVEVVFSWPGMGKYAVDSMLSSDYSPIMAVVLLSAAIYLVVYLIIDVSHYLLDPRTRGSS